MKHTSRLDLACHEDPEFNNKLERARAQATDRIGTVQAIGRLLQEAITAVTLTSGLLAYSPLLVLILFCAIVPAFIGDSYFAFGGYILAFSQTPIRRELDYVRLLASSKETAKEVRLFGLSSYWSALYDDLSRRLHYQNIDLTRRRLLAGFLLSMLTTAAYYGAYVSVIHKTLAGQLSVGALIFLAGAISGTSSKIQSIFSIFSGIADQALFLNDLFDIFSVQPSIRSRPHSLKLPNPIRQGFEFRNVSFAYPGNTDFVLRDLNFSVKKGERLALVGSNGSGKTTIVKLLTRLYDPTGGQVLLDGVDLREYSLAELHRQIAVLFQDFVRYDRTVSQNILIGNVDAPDPSRTVMRAAQKSSAHDFIGKLPFGYAQMLGRRFDGGIDLSGGEWQRLALARAYSRESQLLILDEPSSSLDPAAESELLNQFTKLGAGRMVLLISHRLSTVRMADRIFVLEKGNIVEEGSHSDLIASDTRYCEMFELQAFHYR